MLTNTENVVNAVKYAVRTRKDWEAFMTENKIDRDGIKDAAREIASLAFPSDKPVQKVDGRRTRFGNAVQAAAYMMRAVLDQDKDDDAPTTPDYLALAVQAAKTAHDKGGVSIDDVLTAVTASLVVSAPSDDA
jgi:hypothetical protein